MSIEKLALEYIHSSVEINKTADDEKPSADKLRKIKKTRKALMGSYEKIRERYMEEKTAVDELIEEAKRIQQQFNKHKTKMDTLYKKMTDIRTSLQKMDDDGLNFFEIEEEIADEEENS